MPSTAQASAALKYDSPWISITLFQAYDTQVSQSMYCNPNQYMHKMGHGRSSRSEPAPPRLPLHADSADPLRTNRRRTGPAGRNLDHGHDVPRWSAGAGPVHDRPDRSSL